MRYEQIKPLLSEEVLDEVKMSPSALTKFAKSPEAEGMLMGIEWELCVPNVDDVDDEPNWEYDYDQDERAYSIEGIIDFFRHGDFSNMGSREADRSRSEMYEQYEEWFSDQVRDSDQFRDLIREKLEDYIIASDFEDQAREELGDEAEDTAVEERAEELARESIDEHMNGQGGEYWDSAYDDAYDEAMSDWRDDGDFDEQAWLSDIGVESMSDAEREWGFDWPHMYDSNEGQGGQDLDNLADDFSRAMGGVKVNTSSGYHGATRDGRSWIIEPDGSIDADRGDAGLEFVSPPQPIAQGLETIKQFYAWAKERGCYTNQSTGLHMNISVPDLTVEKLDYVKLALFLGDEYVLKQFGREYNHYAKSAMSKIRDRIRPEDVGAVLNQMKQHLNSLASKTIHSGITDKYTSINTKSNYVEFRGPGGDYLDMDPMDLINTALRAAMALRIASDPEAYKQEYAKKLYKLIEQSPDDDDTVKLFSQYALGEIDKGELAARLEFAQRGRKIEKTKPQVKRLIDEPGVRDQINKFPGHWKNTFSDLHSKSDEELQELQKNFDDLGAYYNFTKEQGQLALALIANELESRQPQGEKKAYWVTKRDGQGGKQMVYARNENEAILIGGKNIGLNRQQSISQLKAVEKTERSPEQLYDGLPEDWKEFVDKIDDASMGVLRGGLDSMTTGRWQYRNLDDDEVEYIKGRIEIEMRNRQEQGENTFDRRRYPAAARDLINTLPSNWRDWVMKIPNKSEGVLRDAVRLGREGRWTQDGIMTQQLANLVVNLVNDELIYRESTGTDKEDGSVELQFKDEASASADSTSDTGREEVLASLPDNVREWLSNINDHSDMGLINILNNPTVTQDMTEQQAAYFRLRIKRELRRRGIEPSEAQPSSISASQSGRELFDSLPENVQQWLTNIQGHGLRNLQQNLDAWRDPSSLNVHGLSQEQRNFVANTIEQELRRRDAEGEPNDQAQEQPQDDLPEHWKDWLTALQAQTLTTLSSVQSSLAAGEYSTLNAYQSLWLRNRIEQELQRRESGAGSQNAAAQQQTQLIQRDDPVSSNDPEARSPIAQDGPGMWMVGNHTYGRETFRADSREDAMTKFARRWDINTADIMDDPGYVVQLVQPDQGELDLREMRRLAGLI